MDKYGICRRCLKEIETGKIPDEETPVFYKVCTHNSKDIIGSCQFHHLLDNCQEPPIFIKCPYEEANSMYNYFSSICNISLLQSIFIEDILEKLKSN